MVDSGQDHYLRLLAETLLTTESDVLRRALDIGMARLAEIAGTDSAAWVACLPELEAGSKYAVSWAIRNAWR